MEPAVLALASNESYFPGLYCAVASVFSHLDAHREVDLKVLDGGISQKSRDTLSRLIDSIGGPVRLEFVPVNPSIFGKATLGPGKSHMAYCRILLPHLLDVPRLIYLDCDVLVFRNLSELFDLELSPSKVVGAVCDSETLTLGEDSQTLAEAMNLPANGEYFNSGVMLMNLSQLKHENFTERSLDFLEAQSGNYRFQEAVRRRLLRNGLAPLRALAFPLASLLYRFAGKKEKAAGYQRAARYWFDYIRYMPSRRQLHRRRSHEISRMKFTLHASPLAS